MIREYDNNVKESIKLSRVFGRRKIWLQIAEIFNSNVIYLAIISFTLYQVSVTGTVLLGGFAIVINGRLDFSQYNDANRKYDFGTAETKSVYQQNQRVYDMQ